MVRRIFKKLKRLKREWDNAEPPQLGLEPIIGNFYGSPPIDPRDCSLYPDSPWCGGNPISKRPISSNFSLVRDECNIGIQLDAVFGFIKMPSVQIVYRNPNCNIKPELPPKDENYEEYPKIPKKLDNYGTYIIYEPYKLDYQDGLIVEGLNSTASLIAYTEIKTELIKYEFMPDNPQTINGFVYSLYMEVQATRKTYENLANHIHSFGGEVNQEFLNKQKEWGLDVPELDNLNNIIEGELDCKMTIYHDLRRGRYITYEPDNEFFRDNIPIPQVIGSSLEDSYLKYNNIKSYFSKDIQDNGFEFTRYPDTLESKVLSDYYARELEITEVDSDIFGLIYLFKTYFVYVHSKEYSIIWTGKTIEDAPPVPKMKCCPKVQENDELLRLIARRIGVYDYPVSVPKFLTDRSTGTESIENLTRFHSWLGKNLDALCGKFPIEIKIEDADIDREGNQEQTVKIPNIAEALAEIVGYLLVLRSESDANLNATIRTLTEAGAAKQSAIIAGDYAKANAEFLGYKGVQAKRQVPFTFKPGEEKLDKMLVNSYIEVKGWENEDKEDIRDILIPLLEMAAAYRTANFRNIGTLATEAALKQILKQPSKYKKDIDTALEVAAIKKKQQKPPESQKDSDLIRVPPDENRFDKFIEDAEIGFTNKNGITNATEPYDRPFDERPRIREIGDNTAK